MVSVGDWVVPKDNPSAVPAIVLAIDDLGHGLGMERVTISLVLPPIAGFSRCYALCELIGQEPGE